ncbi:MAG: hypothetical protein HYZ92_00540 [Candidatus Omnitrophica bacterium]|nr:hypothetical protein [Candidatus Omnitrophota bacterium]
MRASQREKQALKGENQELQQRINSFESERKALEGRVNDLRGQLTSEGAELGALRSSLGEMKQRSELLQREKADLESEVSQLTSERDQAKETFEKSDQARKNLERAASRVRERFAMLDQDYQRLIRRIGDIQRERADQMPQVSVSTWDRQAMAQDPSASSSMNPATSLTSSPALIPSPESGSASSSQPVELPPIVVGKDASAAATPVRGRVVDVNDTNRFIVVNRGVDDGVRVGMTFDLLRGGEMIGQGVVVKVRGALAACDLVASRTSGFPQVGDVAVQHGS